MRKHYEKDVNYLQYLLNVSTRKQDVKQYESFKLLSHDISLFKKKSNYLQQLKCLHFYLKCFKSSQLLTANDTPMVNYQSYR